MCLVFMKRMLQWKKKMFFFLWISLWNVFIGWNGWECQAGFSMSLWFVLSEPVAVAPEWALSDWTESEPPRLPDSAPDGASRPAHTHTRPLLQEETAPGQQRPQQVRRSNEIRLRRVIVTVMGGAWNGKLGYLLYTG